MGLGIPDPYVEGGITRVKWFLNHMGADTVTAEFMGFSLQNMMIETGLPHDVFLQDYKVYGCLGTESWIKQLWKFVHENEIHLVAPKEIMSREVRKGDRVIIQECVRLGYNEMNLIRINRVRNYLQVMFVSDLVEYDGKTIKHAMLEGKKDQASASALTWRKEEPKSRDFSLWKVFVTRLAPNKKLYLSVGIRVGFSHCQSKWYYSEMREEVVYINNKNRNTLFKR